MYVNNRSSIFISALRRRPDATAMMRGGRTDPWLRGSVRFYSTPYGVLVVTEVKGLPVPEGRCSAPVFGFHIHSGGSCTGNTDDQFADALTHYDPQGCPHPHHAGDMPPLFGNNGYAFSMFLTDRFSLKDIIGKTVVIHSMPDDFTTQPAGNSGKKIACGTIR